VGALRSRVSLLSSKPLGNKAQYQRLQTDALLSGACGELAMERLRYPLNEPARVFAAAGLGYRVAEFARGQDPAV
jgi:hypothetical protein